MPAALLHSPPSWLSRVLVDARIQLLLRIGLTSAYWLGGLAKLADWQGAVAEAAHFGLHPAQLAAAATIAVELICSMMIITRTGTWIAAGALGVFTMLATFIAHAFWTMQGQERFFAFNSFFEHLGLVCAFLLLAWHTRASSSSSQ
jgi:uncharacterized membrane protein YphA (DoxX/SURF4 family)